MGVLPPLQRLLPTMQEFPAPGQVSARNVKTRPTILGEEFVVNGRVGAGPSPSESSEVSGGLGAGLLRQRDMTMSPDLQIFLSTLAIPLRLPGPLQ